MKNPTQRDRDTIVAMLQQFRAAQETLLCSEAGGDGNGWKMPKTWTPEMIELDRCLGLLARAKPKHHRHVMSRYVDPVVSRRTMAGRMTRRGARETMVWPQLGPNCEVRIFQKLPEHKSTSTYTCLIASWPGWVNKPLVEQGLSWLLDWYTPPSEAAGPALPMFRVPTSDGGSKAVKLGETDPVAA